MSRIPDARQQQLAAYEPKFADLPAVPYDDRDYPAAVVTMRLPKSTYNALRDLSIDLDLSLNMLAVSKVVAAIDHCELLPGRERAKIARANWRKQDAENS